MMRPFGGLLLLLLCTPVHGAAQLAWEGRIWNIDADEYRLQRFQGREALHLQNGTAWLEGVALEDGVIEFDLHVPGTLGFHGVAFRAADSANYEHFYLRPFNSGRPDASQYTPVFKGVSGWQIYSDGRFGLPVDIPVDRWFHVEVRLLGARAEVHVEGQPLAFPALQRPPQGGAIGLMTGGAPARFANLKIRPGPPELESETRPSAAAAPLPPGIIRRWRVSPAFAEARLDSLGSVDGTLVGEDGWDELEVGARGIANIATIRTRSDATNTAVAAVTLQSQGERLARLRFGFSDRVHVYLNGRPLYRGADGWRSRDYKFLGTIGLHDELVLPLRAGDNELWLAVAENFGGWGVMAQLVDRADIVVTP